MIHISTRISFSAVFAAALLILGFGSAQPAFAQCGNLVVNGDFESGNTGFTSGYTYSPGDLLPEYTYDVLANPNDDHYCFGGVDHTSGSGKLMAVNGAVSPNKVVWQETVTVLANTNYLWSAWVNSQCYATNHAVLSLRVNGTAVGSPFMAPTSVFPWSNWTQTWNSGTNTSATLTIVDLNLYAGGNDFGLDDISFTKIDETPPVIVLNSDQSMWPPDHTYHSFDLSQLVSSVTDDCDANPSVFISSVSSDEPEDGIGVGDGSTMNDIVIAEDCQSVQLRAERQGVSNGRVYSITITAVDASGNASSAVYKVMVNHDQYTPATDDGAAAGYTVSSACGLAKSSTPVSSALNFSLEQNYPNPFKPATAIRYSVEAATHVKLTVYDHVGRIVATLANGDVQPGTYQATFNAQNLPSGVYVYRLETPQGSLAKKMVLMK